MPKTEKLLILLLSITNPSGRHVMSSAVRELMQHVEDPFRVVFVGRPDALQLISQIPGCDKAVLETAPALTASWLPRHLWEFLVLPRILKKHSSTKLLTFSGTLSPVSSVSQVVYCLNPWALTPEAQRLRDAGKAWLQRVAYRRASGKADALLFCSHFLKDAYDRNANGQGVKGEVCLIPPNLSRLPNAAIPRDQRIPGRILTVSVWAPHKNLETLLHAVHTLRRRNSAPISLHVAGGWGDKNYRRTIQDWIQELGLEDCVTLLGFLEPEQLVREYETARVFSLLSRCESFGIPAIEAQTHGTPVVSSTAGAIPEICGDGGVLVPPEDIKAAADAIQTLLDDETRWNDLSRQAFKNAQRFRPEDCFRPLIRAMLG